jgi:Uma2 family endonuclease
MAVLSLNESRPMVRGEDLPYADGIPLESDWHLAAMTLLIPILRYYWRDRRDCYVTGNMFVYFDPDQVKTQDFRGPDFFVVKGVKNNQFRKSWVVWEEDNVTPDFVIELASESTVKFDLTEKKSIYERILKTPEYIVYNPHTEALKGWRLTSGRYTRIAPNEQGRLWSNELALWLGITEHLFPTQTAALKVLRFFDAVGNLVPTPEEAATQRAVAEAEARRNAEAEIDRLKALLAAKK